LSQRKIDDAMQISYNHHFKLQYGKYIQTHEPHGNDMKPHTAGAIVLCPTGNEQGGHRFFNLGTKKW
jgi:hypothetical protein